LSTFYFLFHLLRSAISGFTRWLFLALICFAFFLFFTAKLKFQKGGNPPLKLHFQPVDYLIINQQNWRFRPFSTFLSPFSYILLLPQF
jgi:hypothetical protein